jgi:hypothetical protein
MPRYLGRHPIAYSQRSQRKVRHDQLVEDGEIRGLRVARGEEDQEHPQKFLKPPGADKINLYRPQPENFKYPCTVLVGWDSADLLGTKAGIDTLSISSGPVQLVIGSTVIEVG